jgi:hypothetical protein
VGGDGAAFDVGAVAVRGTTAFVEFGEPATVGGDLAVTATGGTASLRADESFTFGRDVTVRGRQTEVSLIPTGASRIEGSLAVLNPVGTNNVDVNPRVTVGEDVILILTGGDADVTLGGTAAGPAIAGNLSITTGAAADEITLQGLGVAGTTTIRTGGGNDDLEIDLGARFTGPFFADLGAGNDDIEVAQEASAIPVTFAGKATALAGQGNDTLKLGAAGRRAVFGTPGSTIDGGPGANEFDDELGSFDGIALGTGVVNWTDPTP